MSLTGVPLLAAAVLATLAALAGTVGAWSRRGRLRHLARPAGVLLTEALLLVTVGLVVNRSEQFYPTWAALLRPTADTGAAYRTTAGRLDAWLTRRGAGPDESQTFSWQPQGWTDWGLAAPPTVVVPAGYLRHPIWRYSVVLVVSAEADGWQPAAPPGGYPDSTVLVYASTGPATRADVLSGRLPEGLDRDLRVTGHRWALVSSARDEPLAGTAITAAAGRFPALAVVRAGDTRPAPRLPAGIQVALFGAAAPPHPPGHPRPVPPAAALTWAAAQTPPPLAAPSAPVRSLPVPPPHHHRPPHRTPRATPPGRAGRGPTPTGVAVAPGGTRGTG